MQNTTILVSSITPGFHPNISINELFYDYDYMNFDLFYNL